MARQPFDDPFPGLNRDVRRGYFNQNDHVFLDHELLSGEVNYSS
jgi:hypothetical protein